MNEENITVTPSCGCVFADLEIPCRHEPAPCAVCVERGNIHIPDEVDLQGCEICLKEYDIEIMLMMEDNWICPECYAEWKAEFDACEHEWVPHVDTMGDPGRCCKKCSGFVVDDPQLENVTHDDRPAT